MSTSTPTLFKAIYAWPCWAAPAVLGAAIAGVEFVGGGHAAGRVLADAWMITVAGAISIDSTRPTGMSDLRRRLLLVSLLPAILLASRVTFGPSIRDWDWMYLSGVFTLLVGVELSEHMGTMLDDMLRTLVDGGALRMTNRRLRRLRRDVRRMGRRYQNAAGAVVGGAVLAGWVIYGVHYLPFLLTHNPAGVIFESLAGVVAGQRLGRMVAYGFIWRLLRKETVKLRVVPGHPDGTVGLKPIGRFYFRQSLVVGLPAAYLAVWWFLIPLLPPSYLHWRSTYLGLLAIAIAFELLAFFLPMRAVHRVMLLQARRWISQADRLAVTIEEIQASLVAGTGDHEELTKRLATLADWYRTLHQMPTWPVDQSLKRWLSLNNIALFIPFLGYLLGDAELWKQVADVVGGLKH